MRIGRTYAPSGDLTYANVQATVAAARADGRPWHEPTVGRHGVSVGDHVLRDILVRGGFDWMAATSAQREAALAKARQTLKARVRVEHSLTSLVEQVVTEQERAMAAAAKRKAMLAAVDQWPRLRLQEHNFGELDAVLATEPETRAALVELRTVLGESHVPPQRRKKSQEWYIYDQSQLQKIIRDELAGLGWSRGQVLAPAEEVGRVNVAAAKADLLKDGVHAMFDFGNRAAYAYHFFTQAFLAQAVAQVRVTALVVPTNRFADCIDSNLTTYERVNVEVRRVAGINGAAPSPLAVIGVEQDVD